MRGVESQRELQVGSKGLTWRTMLAFFFITFIIQPAIVYNWLVNGLWGLAFGSWATILLWVGLTRLLGSPLNSKEIFVIRIVESTGLMNTGYYFAYLLRNQYFANSEVAKMFGFQQEIPAFFSPVGEDAIRSMLNRTFFDWSWAMPILFSVCVPVLLSALANYTLGLMAYNLYMREEKLKFPIASIDAQTMRAFGERDEGKIRVIVLSITAGAAYGFATYGITSILGISLVPRYLVDFTSMVETALPGASFSFETDLTVYLVGFVIDIKYTLAQLIASIALYFVGTSYVTVNGLWPDESKWFPNQGVLWLYNRSTLYFWNSFTIGWGLAVASIPLIVRYKKVIRAFARVRVTLLLVYLSTASASILLTMYLIPGFPLWILVAFTLGMSFIMTLLQTHSAGVTAGFSVPYLRETMIYFSGYNRLDIWFFPPEVVLFVNGSAISQQLLQASVMGVDVKEYTKTYFLIIVLGLIGSLAFVSIFWRLNPIPGWAYPYTISAWPVEAMNFWRWQSWLRSGYLFRSQWMLSGFGASSVLYLISDLVFHLPSFPIAMMTGMLMPPYIALSQFVGSLLSKGVGRFVGRELWESQKGFVVIGIFIGDGLVTTILTIIVLLTRSTWLMPY